MNKTLSTIAFLHNITYDQAAAEKAAAEKAAQLAAKAADPALDTPSPVKETKGAPVTPNRGRIGSDLSTTNIKAKNDSLKEVWILAHDQELKASFDGYYSSENGIFENTLINLASMESGAIKGLTQSTEGEFDNHA